MHMIQNAILDLIRRATTDIIVATVGGGNDAAWTPQKVRFCGGEYSCLTAQRILERDDRALYFSGLCYQEAYW